MVANGIYDFRITMHDIQYAIGQPCFFQQHGNTAHDQRYFFRWFKNHTISKCNGIGYGPVWNHSRKIEWNDGGHYTYGHTFDAAIYALAHFQSFTGYQLGKGTGEFGQFNTFFNFSYRFVQRFT